MQTLLKKLAASACAAALVLPSIAPVSALAADKPATLEGLAIGSDEVRLRLSDQVRFNVFVTAEPARLVVELLGTEDALPTKPLEGRGQVLKKVRTGQYQRDPNLITRIVLDMSRLTAYRANWEGKELVVRLAAGGKAVENAQAPAPAPAPVKPMAPKPAMVAQAPAPAAVPTPAPVSDAVAAKPEARAELPEKMTTEASPEVTRIARSRDASGEDGSGQPPASRRVPASSSGYMTRRDILATLPMDLTSLDFDATDIREILKLMAVKAKINIVYSSDVAGTVTLHVTDVPFSEAFTTLLSMQGLVANQVGENVVRVMTPASLAKERTVAVNQTRVIKLKYAKAADISIPIKAVRQAEARGGNLTIDDTTNSVIITDTLDGIASTERLIAQLDTRPQQVMIEAKLVEVKLSKDVHFGIQWDYFNIDSAKIGGQQGINTIGTHLTPDGTFSKPFDQSNFLTPTVDTGASGRGTGVSLPASKVFGAFTFGRVTNNYFLSATLTAAASQGKVKVLSDPKITTLNGKRAAINITTQIPYVTSSVTSTGVTTQAVTYTQTGILLEVTPTLNADGRVTLEVSPTVSQPSSIAASAGTTGAPAIDSRTAKTIVLVQDGETIVIGGLITDSVSNVVAKIPILGDIPILGWLFKKKDVQRDRVELLIFVTPRIVPS
jgi:type IV pilus assembly protein PilQ